MIRFFAVFAGLAILFLIPFLIWGEVFITRYEGQGAQEWLEGYGSWAWAPGVVLLLLDLFLPIPATAVMAALGFLYGPILGGIISALGSMASGILAYSLCRVLGRNVAQRWLGEEELHRGERLFRRTGGWLVAVSRWLPLMPEVIACMAGLTRMPFRAFVLALACGSLPLGFTYAVIGHAGVDHPVLAVSLSALAPPLLWLAVRNWLVNRYSLT